MLAEGQKHSILRYWGRYMLLCLPASSLCIVTRQRVAHEVQPVSFGGLLLTKEVQFRAPQTSLMCFALQVKGVIQQLRDNGQNVDLNVVLDRLMNRR